LAWFWNQTKVISETLQKHFISQIKLAFKNNIQGSEYLGTNMQAKVSLHFLFKKKRNCLLVTFESAAICSFEK